MHRIIMHKPSYCIGFSWNQTVHCHPKTSTIMHKSHNASLCMGFGPERTLCVMTISTVLLIFPFQSCHWPLSTFCPGVFTKVFMFGFNVRKALMCALIVGWCCDIICPVIWPLLVCVYRCRHRPKLLPKIFLLSFVLNTAEIGIEFEIGKMNWCMPSARPSDCPA